MATNKGIVTYFDGEYGEITKENDKYIFLKQDILNDLNKGAFVSFRGEEVQGTKRAYFVNNLEMDKLPDIEKDRQK